MDLVMATAAKAVIYPHITKTPDVCGGQPVIDDTRVRVKNLVALLKERTNNNGRDTADGRLGTQRAEDQQLHDISAATVAGQLMP